MTGSGSMSRSPMTLMATLCSWTSGSSANSYRDDSNSSIRYSTSLSARLKFSVEKAYTVSILTSSLRHQWRTSSSLSLPSL